MYCTLPATLKGIKRLRRRDEKPVKRATEIPDVGGRGHILPGSTLSRQLWLIHTIGSRWVNYTALSARCHVRALFTFVNYKKQQSTFSRQSGVVFLRMPMSFRMFSCFESMESSGHVSKIPGQKKALFWLKPFWSTIYPPRDAFLLFLCLLPPGCVGRDWFFLPDFSFATELGAEIITCLYDQLPDYSPRIHKMCEEESQGLYWRTEGFSYLHVVCYIGTTLKTWILFVYFHNTNLH